MRWWVVVIVLWLITFACFAWLGIQHPENYFKVKIFLDDFGWFNIGVVFCFLLLFVIHCAGMDAVETYARTVEARLRILEKRASDEEQMVKIFRRKE